MVWILSTNLALPWSLVLQVAFWLAGGVLLWVGGRFLAKLGEATFGRSVWAYLLIVVTGVVILKVCIIIAWQVGPGGTSLVLWMKLTYLLLAVLASWCIIKVLFRASWGKAILAWLATLVIFAVSTGIGLGSAWGPTKIELSYETTRILRPVNDDGTVNYLAALNEQYSKGVTAENNAAILLLQAAGPEMLPLVIKDELLAILGLPALPRKGDYFVRFATYAGESKEGNIFSLEAPWSAKDYPKVADWLKANEKALSLVVAATNRPRYYMPMLSADEPPRVISLLIPGVQIQREMANALVSRAMLKLDSGDIDGARADILAVHRLARLGGQGPTIIERLVGAAAESQACEGDNALATSGRLSSSQAQAYLAMLEGLPRLPNMAECIDRSVRFFGLAGVMLCHREGFESLSSVLGGKWKEKREYCWPDQIDWNEVLRVANLRYDRLAEAAGKETFRERQEAFKSVSHEISTLRVRQNSGFLSEIRRGLGLGDRDDEAPYPRTTREASDRILDLLFPAVGRASAQCDLAVMKLRMSKVAIALAGYQAEHGDYPASLGELCPKYFKTVPEDLFTAEPMDYQRVKSGYVLYSGGANANKGYDDIVIQIPPAKEIETVEKEPGRPGMRRRSPRPRRR